MQRWKQESLTSLQRKILKLLSRHKKLDSFEIASMLKVDHSSDEFQDAMEGLEEYCEYDSKGWAKDFLN